MKYSIKRIKTPKGATKYELRLTTGRGKDVKKRTLRFDTKADADLGLADELKLQVERDKRAAELKRLGLSASDAHTWDTELAYWNKHAKPTLSPGWVQSIEAFEKEVKKFLTGKLVYAEISHQLIDEIVAFLRTSRPIMKDDKVLRMKHPDSDKTIWLKVGWIQSVLNFSVKKKRIKYSPIAEYEKTKPEEVEIDFWEMDQAESFLDFADKRYPTGSPRRWIYVIYLTIINAALREAEAFALKPRCIKRSISQIYLTEQWNRVSKKFTGLKGDKARSVPMNDTVLFELEALIKQMNLKPNDLIFSLNGEPLDAKNFYSQLHRDTAKWGGEEISVQGLRHTGATLMILAGIDLRTVQRILGHTDVKTTERYTHLVNTSITKAAKQFSVSTRASKSKIGVNTDAAQHNEGPLDAD